MLISIRYTKDLGNSAVYYRVRSSSGDYLNFQTQVFTPSETSATKIFLTERQDSDPNESLYCGDAPYLEQYTEYIQELVDEVEGITISSGVYTSQREPHNLDDAHYAPQYSYPEPAEIVFINVPMTPSQQTEPAGIGSVTY